MRRLPRSHLLVVAVTVALALTPVVAAALPAQAGASNESAAPGEQFAGVVGVQGAEVDGAVENRAFGTAIAAAESNESKAAVVADRVAVLQDRLTDLRDRRADLRTALDNGSIDRGQYRARIASVAARTAAVERQLNRSESVAVGLPDQARRGADLNVTAVRELRQSARDLRGGDVGRSARMVAGRGVGNGVPAGPPDGMPGAGGPVRGGPRNGTDMGSPGGSDRGPRNGTDMGGRDRGDAPNGTEPGDGASR